MSVGRQGVSLVEVLVALVLLALLAATTASTARQIALQQRRTHRGTQTDLSRRRTAWAVTSSDACRSAPQPTRWPLRFAATDERPALTIWIRCGP